MARARWNSIWNAAKVRTGSTNRGRAGQANWCPHGWPRFWARRLDTLPLCIHMRETQMYTQENSSG